MGWGGGGMLTFLVLRTLYVATLQRSLVLLLHYMLLRLDKSLVLLLRYMLLRLDKSLVLLLRYMLLRLNKSLVFSGAVATRTLYVATLLVMGWGGGVAC